MIEYRAMKLNRILRQSVDRRHVDVDSYSPILIIVHTSSTNHWEDKEKKREINSIVKIDRVQMKISLLLAKINHKFRHCLEIACSHWCWCCRGWPRYTFIAFVHVCWAICASCKFADVGIILTYLKIIQQLILSMVICFLLAAFLLAAHYICEMQISDRQEENKK